MSEEKKISIDEYQKALFAQLAMMLASSALQQMGKLVNPVTKKAEVNLEGAQATIDLIDMLAAKTRGNLDKEEERMMSEILSSLKLNYVETAQGAPAGAAPAPSPTSPEAAPSAQPPTAGDDDREPKFHKKYG